MPRSENAQKRAEWRARLRRFKESKWSVAEFCRRENVSAASFYQWRRKLADSSSTAPVQRSPARANFVPVQVAAATGLQVTFPNGARLSLAATDHELIRISIAAIAQARTQGEA